MRNASRCALFAGAVAVIAVLAAPASAGQPLTSQDRSGFGEPIAFTQSGYTPEGITSLVYAPLASQDGSGFGEAIAFTPSGYTPQGITSLSTIDVAATR